MACTPIFIPYLWNKTHNLCTWYGIIFHSKEIGISLPILVQSAGSLENSHIAQVHNRWQCDVRHSTVNY